MHRFNKAQQDAFLPFVEHGLVTFIGATTENPSFEVNSALLSRATVYVLESLVEDELARCSTRAAAALQSSTFDDERATRLIGFADGDARRLLNAAGDPARRRASRQVRRSTAPSSRTTLAQNLRRFDKGGEQFYDQISALHKSVRGSDPDAALYWLVRMLDGGADPLYLGAAHRAHGDRGHRPGRSARAAHRARRRARPTSGSARPKASWRSPRRCSTWPCAAKSNAVYVAYNAARAFVAEDGTRPVPLHLRNAPTKLMKDLGYGKDYRYAHDEPDALRGGRELLARRHAGGRAGTSRPSAGWKRKIGEKLAELRRLQRRGAREAHMIDIQLLRTDIGGVAQRLATRGYELDVAGFEELEDASAKTSRPPPRSCSRSATRCRSRSGRPRRKGRQARGELLAQAAESGDKLKQMETENAAVQAKLQEFVSLIPNLPHESVPVGNSSDQNEEKRRWGTPRQFDFAAKDHVDIGAASRPGFRDRRQDRRRALRGDARAGRAPAPRARAVHARRAHARARLHRGLRRPTW